MPAQAVQTGQSEDNNERGDGRSPNRKIKQWVLARNLTKQANHGIREKNEGSQNSPGDAESQYEK